MKQGGKTPALSDEKHIWAEVSFTKRNSKPTHPEHVDSVLQSGETKRELCAPDCEKVSLT